MNNFEKEFVEYTEALELKQLGFDEPCMASRDMNNKEGIIQIPLYQQAFRWLYQKLGVEKGVMPLDTESQKLLLKQLINEAASKHLLV
jgi:hypothetical protein